MTTIDVVALQNVDQGELSEGGPDRYDYNRLPEHLRPAAMTAQGTVVEGLTSAVRRVLDAGQALAWAKSELPHGEYLPWVQQACGLKPDHAQKLVQAAEWYASLNAEHVRHLQGITDTVTLFLLSADATTEDVREWFMERCAAGDLPTRKEVQQRKRTAGQQRQPQPTETLALNFIRKGELDRVREALDLAARAVVLTAEQVMAEQRLRELGKQRIIYGMNADFHRQKDGTWIRLPHAGRVEVESTPEPSTELAPEIKRVQTELIEAEPCQTESLVLSRCDAAAHLGMAADLFSQSFVPSKNPQGFFIRNGWRVDRVGFGLYRLTKLERQQ